MHKRLALTIACSSLMLAAPAFAQESVSGQDGAAYVPRQIDGSEASAPSSAENEKKLQAQIDSLQAEINALKAQTQALETKASELQMNQTDAAIKLEETRSLAEKSSGDSSASRFRFGSYGRVQPSMNADGMKSGRQPRIVYPSPRVDEGSYVELWFGYNAYKGEDGATVDVVSTIAFSDDKLFHRDGIWDSSIAIRNLYVEARDVWFQGLVFWAGSRMYRGDDIYLLDTWPLDNLNTYGGGLGYHSAKYAGNMRTNFDVHFGTNRLNNDYQYQVVDTVDERFVGKTDVIFLDRQRFITSIKAEQLFGGDDSPLFKIKLYSEIHSIDKGEHLETQPEQITELPKDFGWLIGGQFGISNFLDGSYANLFIKYATGLAAYGEMGIPFGVNTSKTAEDAKNLTVGLSAGLNILNYADVLFGGYVRYFTDADGVEEDFDDGVEGVWDLRLTGHVGKYFRPGIELSQQLRRPNGLNPASLKQELASIFKFSLLPAVRFGDGVLGRPEFRFNYTLSVLNDAAKMLYNEKDYLRGKTYVHFVGFAAEWWFNL